MERESLYTRGDGLCLLPVLGLEVFLYEAVACPWLLSVHRTSWSDGLCSRLNLFKGTQNSHIELQIKKK